MAVGTCIHCIVALLMVSICFTSSLTKKCNFILRFRLLDCAGKGFTMLPCFDLNLEATTVTLKNNNIRHFNLTELAIHLPNVKTIILTGNPSLNCTSICVQIATDIKIISNCECATTTRETGSVRPTSFITEKKLYTTVYPSQSSSTEQMKSTVQMVVSQTLTQLVSSPTTYRTFTWSLNKSNKPLYVVTIIPSLLFVLLLMIMIFMIRTYRNHRYSRIRMMEEIVEMEQLVSEENSEEEQIVTFDRAEISQGAFHEDSDDDDIVVYDRRDFVTTSV